ncbi:hypothetical protein SELSPUOL_01563 [Selenomonas sputigena ATCC 35185]|uniref:Uncharacterized protein n=1 Tax=Selenomonas sputigena (strain ATCC 35185 / DSM 20758 / CCUG 44933 / VPI D19B-28) TaxID=546271 RepID=C9LVR9_SELS3|nr:hypothetical protein SELSPUOL_01563 [Selenomonas sputigena ATCC 35185]
MRFGIQKESRSALFLYASFEAGITYHGRTFFDTQKRLLATIIDSKKPLAGVCASSCIRAGHFYCSRSRRHSLSRWRGL